MLPADAAICVISARRDVGALKVTVPFRRSDPGAAGQAAGGWDNVVPVTVRCLLADAKRTVAGIGHLANERWTGAALT